MLQFCFCWGVIITLSFFKLLLAHRLELGSLAQGHWTPAVVRNHTEALLKSAILYLSPLSRATPVTLTCLPGDRSFRVRAGRVTVAQW